jgi:hypothetical protein
VGVASSPVPTHQRIFRKVLVPDSHSNGSSTHQSYSRAGSTNES